MKIMTNEEFERLVSDCRVFDPFTQYIDNYRQEKEAEAMNAVCVEEFCEIIGNYIDGVVRIPDEFTNCRYVKTELRKWLSDHDVQVATKVWTEDEIKNLLQTDTKFLCRALKRLYERQTVEEKSSKDTHVVNGRGFNKIDAELLSGICEWGMAHGKLTDKQVEIVRKRIMKYAKQLASIANAG